MLKRDVEDDVVAGELNELVAFDFIQLNLCLVGVNFDTDNVLNCLCILASFLPGCEVSELLRGHDYF